MTSTPSQSHRWRIIDREIRTGRYPSSNRLAAILNVSGRTVRRDIDAMREKLGAPLAFDPVHNGYHYAEPSYRLPLPALPAPEARSLATPAAPEEESPVEVRVRFEPGLEGAVSAHGSPAGGRWQYLTDGGAELSVLTDQVDVLLRWVLGWGPGAQVLSPPWVRRRMRETVRRILHRYQGRAPRSTRAGRSPGSARKVYKPPSPRGRSV